MQLSPPTSNYILEGEREIITRNKPKKLWQAIITKYIIRKKVMTYRDTAYLKRIDNIIEKGESVFNNPAYQFCRLLFLSSKSNFDKEKCSKKKKKANKIND